MCRLLFSMSQGSANSTSSIIIKSNTSTNCRTFIKLNFGLNISVASSFMVHRGHAHDECEFGRSTIEAVDCLINHFICKFHIPDSN